MYTNCNLHRNIWVKPMSAYISTRLSISLKIGSAQNKQVGMKRLVSMEEEKVVCLQMHQVVVHNFCLLN